MEIDGEPQILEPKKFSHIGWGKIKQAKTKNASIDFGDVQVQGLEEIMTSGGSYPLRLVESGTLEILNSV